MPDHKSAMSASYSMWHYDDSPSGAYNYDTLGFTSLEPCLHSGTNLFSPCHVLACRRIRHLSICTKRSPLSSSGKAGKTRGGNCTERRFFSFSSSSVLGCATYGVLQHTYTHQPCLRSISSIANIITHQTMRSLFIFLLSGSQAF